MQDLLQKIKDEIEKFIEKPPSRPVKIIFLNSKYLYDKTQEIIRKDVFYPNEVIYASDFFKSEIFLNKSKRLEELEKKYSKDNSEFQYELSNLLYEFIEINVKDQNLNKVLLMEDEDIYNFGLNPFDFGYGYLIDESNIFVNNEIPLIWLTIGSKSLYENNTYYYYKTNTTDGRVIKLKQPTFESNVLDYHYDL